MRWGFSPLPPLGDWLEAMRAFRVGPEAALAYLERGFRSPEDLDPPLTLLPLRGLEEAAELVLEAIRKGKRIRIHGDYDADGLTGTAILLKGLRALGAEVHAFIPHRLEEGYGILWDRLPEHIAEADLFITVDCGVTNHAELKELVENGVEVLVTDHHTPRDTPPPGLIVHPAYSGLAEKPTGAGVAFLLLWKVHERLGLPPPLDYADLAAVGTIADVAPLTGWNRALVREGLGRISTSAHLGLRLLAQAVGYGGQAVEVAFRIAPRINAASRLGEAEAALALLLAQEEAEAQALVQRLNALNARRQAIEEEMLARLLPQAEAETGRALVLQDPEGHPGVMGLVASRLLERFYKPVFIVAQGKGSVRSVPGISAVGALDSAKDLLLRYGGHKEAAGFALDESRFGEFKRRIEAYVAAHPKPEREVRLTALLPSGARLKDLYAELMALEPFGAGNPEPLFLLEGEVEEVRPLGERHRAFRVAGVRVVEWRSGAAKEQEKEALPLGGRVRLAGVLARNEWQGSVRYEVHLQAHLEGPPEAPWADFLLGEDQDQKEAWAVPVPVEEALGLARSGVGVYLPEEARAWGERQGFRVLPLEEAEVWLGLPVFPSGSRPLFPSGSKPGPFRGRPSRVRVALGRRSRALLGGVPDGGTPKGPTEGASSPEAALQAYLARLLLYAYEQRAEGLFSEALARYLELSEALRGQQV
ncbi:single-stranded-DNA-specific exonuclease RecJ [Thermus filiformis]|uniref:Single-stranded-DNA-specific exonuclease RecJ n=1 Tax=Thermus filiformis TaxID=276 RepID=A0A0A2WQE3_THEFI|nr:DHH family phosphoesterase [Thermus filiformis]KGQ20982.2 recombinase RecJ [Thermus filiformis]